ncbi:MAG TPA: hypothetical protein VHV77_04050 [Pirellulales bacterium]|jgi:hypothetical protein|nr:hypothetical protein [Pirellulales bacterium]
MFNEFPLSDLGNVTATAILGWYAWHTASKTIPNTLRAFREEAALTRAECRSERETLYQELAAERLQRHSDHMAIIEALNELSLRVHKPERT